MQVQVNLVPAGARPMHRMSTSPLSPSRISDLDYAPTSASPAMCPGSFLGLLGPNGPIVGLFVRMCKPEPCFQYPPLMA